ncbi:potassium channel family protein [Sphingomonas sp. PAMC 26621]|uniref:potassium channel family protein n=1 Tax=Sphingomonas sp. PAMC 26621 TaxID=1112213 RepID=UPI001EE69358|nr:potassium channel family protein [Sphingomonas sp. PAMC 26621]
MASIMVGLSVIVHFAGLSVLLALVRRHRRGTDRVLTFIANGAVIAGAALGLFALHGIEIWGYALLYRTMGWFATFEQALYFSTSTYATIGYGDVVLLVSSRLLGAIEGVNGVILLGWSTAFFFTIVHRMTSIERDLGRGPAPLQPDPVQPQCVRHDDDNDGAKPR